MEKVTEFVNLNIWSIVFALLIIKYSIQFYSTILTRKQKIILRGKPYIHSAIIWIIALSIFGVLILNHDRVYNHFSGVLILFVAIILGITGILRLGRNYNEDLAIYENSKLIKKGVFGIIRHPIRLGVCLEVLSFTVFINSIYILPLQLMYLYLNYKRTIKEEEFLMTAFDGEAKEYFTEVPRFNLIKGFLRKLMSLLQHLQVHLRLEQTNHKNLKLRKSTLI